jgi:hypothetical protein
MLMNEADVRLIRQRASALEDLRTEACTSGGNASHRRSLDAACTQVVGAVETLLKLALAERPLGPRQPGPPKTQKQSPEHEAEHALSKGLERLLPLVTSASVDLTQPQQKAFLGAITSLAEALADCGILLSQGGSNLNMTNLPYTAGQPSGMKPGDEVPMKYVEGFEPSNRGFFLKLQREREKLDRTRERD